MSATASAFSSSDTAALERQAEEAAEAPVTLDDIWNETHKKVSVGWIRQNGLKRVCLQFPDDYLQYSSAICDSLKSTLGQKDETKVFIMADTTYGSCCVDEIAAAHVEADSVIHFGNACRSKASRLPVLYLYPHLTFVLENMLEKFGILQNVCEGREVCVYLDISYQHVLEQQMEEAGEAVLHSRLQQSLLPKELHIEAYPPPEDAKSEYEPSADRISIFIGSDNLRFANVSLSTKASQWYIYDPATNSLAEKNPLTTNYIRRRYYYIEKCKDAQTLGLIVATLTADGYLNVVSRLQEMSKSLGIKTQIISVGRINPAKLANFLEIDCFVLIGCPFNNMYNSKDYYKPIVSVFEAEMALNPAWHMKYPEAYVTDFKQLLPEGRSFLPFEADNKTQDVSLVSGRVRGNAADGEPSIAERSTELVTQAKMALMTSNSGLTFEDRTWQGLDPALGLTEPAKLQKGLSGIPIEYTHD